MKILITGGAGFLGSNLAADAMLTGHDVTVFDNLSRMGSRENLPWLQSTGSFAFVHGDVRSRNDIFSVINNCSPDVIFHLAGQVAMTTSISNPILDFEVNTVGTLNLLESVRICSPHTLVIYSSTNKVYGDLDQYSYHEEKTRFSCVEKPLGFDEKTDLSFQSPYGCSKGAADQYMLDYARIFGLKTVVLRHSSMYGGRQFATFDQGWIGWFCQQAIDSRLSSSGNKFTISGSGKQVRDVLHSEDMKELYKSMIDNVDKVSGQAFNIGGGIENSLSLLELFAMLEKELDTTLLYDPQSPRVSDQLFFVADTSKVTSLTGWRPKITAQEGISAMVRWLGERRSDIKI